MVTKQIRHLRPDYLMGFFIYGELFSYHRISTAISSQILAENGAIIGNRVMNTQKSLSIWTTCWLVGCFGFNGTLRQYFSLYRAVSQREGEIEENG